MDFIEIVQAELIEASNTVAELEKAIAEAEKQLNYSRAKVDVCKKLIDKIENPVVVEETPVDEGNFDGTGNY